MDATTLIEQLVKNKEYCRTVAQRLSRKSVDDFDKAILELIHSIFLVNGFEVNITDAVGCFNLKKACEGPFIAVGCPDATKSCGNIKELEELVGESEKKYYGGYKLSEGSGGIEMRFMASSNDDYLLFLLMNPHGISLSAKFNKFKVHRAIWESDVAEGQLIEWMEDNMPNEFAAQLISLVLIVPGVAFKPLSCTKVVRETRPFREVTGARAPLEGTSRHDIIPPIGVSDLYPNINLYPYVDPAPDDGMIVTPEHRIFSRYTQEGKQDSDNRRSFLPLGSVPPGSRYDDIVPNVRDPTIPFPRPGPPPSRNFATGEPDPDELRPPFL